MATPPLLDETTTAIIARPGLDQSALRCLVARDAGVVLASFHAAQKRALPTRHTIQMSRSLHIELMPERLRYTNHSCDPNVFFDVDRGELVSLQAIAAGDELVYFYPSTEWELDSAFDCQCHRPRCVGRIAGAAFLADEVLQGYRLSAYIRERLAERASLAEPST